MGLDLHGKDPDGLAPTPSRASAPGHSTLFISVITELFNIVVVATKQRSVTNVLVQKLSCPCRSGAISMGSWTWISRRTGDMLRGLRCFHHKSGTYLDKFR